MRVVAGTLRRGLPGRVHTPIVRHLGGVKYYHFLTGVSFCMPIRQGARGVWWAGMAAGIAASVRAGVVVGLTVRSATIGSGFRVGGIALCGRASLRLTPAGRPARSLRPATGSALLIRMASPAPGCPRVGCGYARAGISARRGGGYGRFSACSPVCSPACAAKIDVYPADQSGGIRHGRWSCCAHCAGLPRTTSPAWGDRSGCGV